MTPAPEGQGQIQQLPGQISGMAIMWYTANKMMEINLFNELH